ncbi:Sel1 repeat-containing protein [Besnoitia besnoiti]|uniref:Sel1 repeat-containing protein n=1 Tax=Besnoitia besnoiti TaxID=94643 RepID=A0A2A9MD69_BESBE|nr:Sel1 repeat-containing protein [Besnoitia besnoiti]PFH33322.1 Sel1 repeat-containing protein [Besnoitia besnoiti]
MCIEGHKYRFGYGVPADVQRAFKLYQEAGSLLDPEALVSAGILLEEGMVDPDIEYDQLAKVLAVSSSGSPQSGSHGEQHLPKRSTFLQLGSEAADERPLHVSAWLDHPAWLPVLKTNCFHIEEKPIGLSNTNDRLKAARCYYEAAARLGHPDALFRLGKMVERGQAGLLADITKAANLYAEAAELGHADAQVAVGYACEHGSCGWQRDYQQAILWYQKATAQGSPTAANNLASMYYHGRGCPQDFEKAAELFKNAAAGGSTNALYNLGVCYEFGHGVTAEDSDRALQLYQKAAHAGHVKAAGALGMLLFRLSVASGKPAGDYAKAAKWLRVAAEQKDADAAFGLGQLFEAGLGTEALAAAHLGYCAFRKDPLHARLCETASEDSPAPLLRALAPLSGQAKSLEWCVTPPPKQ